jgi:hypothetical protein
MSEESAYPDEAIATLLGLEALPHAVRHQLGSVLGQSYTVRCAALHLVLMDLPGQVRDCMSPEQLSVVSLGRTAAAEALGCP